MEKSELRKKSIAFIALIGTFFVWGSNYVAGKFAMADLPPGLAASGRYLVACIALSIVGRRCFSVKIEKGDWIHFFVVGGIGYYLQILVNMMGLARLGASTAALINALNPVTITIISAIVLKEGIRFVHIICIVLSVISTVIISRGTTGNAEMVGLLLSLSAVIFWSIASVDIKRMSAKYGSMTVTLYGSLISMIFYVPTAAYDLVRHEGVRLTMSSTLAIIYLGVVGAALGSYLWGVALSSLEASFCSMFYPLQAIFSALMGAALLNEKLHSSFYWGVLLTAVSVVLICLHSFYKNDKKGRSTHEASK